MNTRRNVTDAVRARLKLSRLCTLLARGHMMSAVLAASLVLGMGDFVASYDVQPLAVDDFVAFVTNKPVPLTVAVTGGRGRRVQARSQLCNYLFRPRRFGRLSVMEFVALTTTRARAAREDDESAHAYYNFLPGHPQAARIVCVLRTGVRVIPQLLCTVPEAGTDEETALQLALVCPFRENARTDTRPPRQRVDEFLARSPVNATIWRQIAAWRDTPFAPAPVMGDDTAPPAPQPAEPAEAGPVVDTPYNLEAAACVGLPALAPGTELPEPAVPVHAPPPDVCAFRAAPQPAATARERAHGERPAAGVVVDPRVLVTQPGNHAVMVAICRACNELCPTSNIDQVSVALTFVNAVYRRQPARMICVGGAGTGKTTVIQIIMHALRQLGLAQYVALVAYTHRAVVPLLALGGRTGTTSAFFGLDPRHRFALRLRAAGVEAEQRMATILGVILDECSLVGVAQLRAIESRMRLGNPFGPDDERPFGAAALMLTGDYAQHRCLGDEPLFAGWADALTTSVAQARRLLEAFDSVTFLQRVVRSDASAGGVFLNEWVKRVNLGLHTEADMDALNLRHLGSGQPGVPASMDDPSLRDAIIIVIRNSTGNALLEAQLLRMARAAGQRLWKWVAEDVPAGASRQPNRLPRYGYFFPGMRCAIADTIYPDAAVVRNNDAQLLRLAYTGPVDASGEILCIPPGNMPEGVFARVNGCTRGMVPGWDRDVVFLRPRTYVGDGVRRRNIPTLPLATATDFFAEGATIRLPQRMVVDLRRPARGNGPLARASIIVAITRVTSWHEVLLLRPLWTEAEHAAQRAFYRKTLMPGLDLALFHFDLALRAGVVFPQTREEFRLAYLRMEGRARREHGRFHARGGRRGGR